MTSDADSNRESTGIPHKRFATTSWKMVVDAASDSQEKQKALSQLCESYWYPLYAYARRRGNSVTDAEDLTQAFFAHLLSQNRLAAADQSRGRFRTFLLTAMDNFLKNDWRSKQALKRGGDEQILSLDFEDAESRYQNNRLRLPRQTTRSKGTGRSKCLTVFLQVFSSSTQIAAKSSCSNR